MELRAARAEPVLRGIDLSVHAGQVVAIEGASDSGKTVLCDVVTLARRVDAGEALYRGRHPDPLDEAERAALIGYVLEDKVFAPASLAANISGIETDVTTPRVGEVAKDVGLHAAIAALPNGYGTQITEDGLPLSRGQRERLALARALYRGPCLLVVDASSAILLDMPAAAGVGAFLSRGGAILLATRHRPAVAHDVVRYELLDGRLTPVLHETWPAAAVRLLGAGGTPT